MEPKPQSTDQPITHEDLTIRPRPETAERLGAEHPEGSNEIILSAEETQFVAVGGPRSGTEAEGGTQDAGIHPDEEIPDAG
ncbi:MAG TPA: hypothetical protein VD886_04045 [Herpetosiphonaceae bacterium]|nr:hypothetical protein [Herpetosiphonaceae bacterium]